VSRIEPSKAVSTSKADNVRSMSAHRGLCVFYSLLGFAFIVLFGSESKGMSIVGPALLLLAIGFAHGAIAFGAARSAPWARVSSMVVGCLMLLGFPIGTLIGVYLLANLKWPKQQAL
jgi:hypothetical protein